MAVHTSRWKKGMNGPRTTLYIGWANWLNFRYGWNYDVQNRSPQRRYKVWKGTASPWQVMKKRWYKDGTPTKEHALTLNSAVEAYNEAETVEKNGTYYLKNSNKPFTGRIVKMMRGEIQIEVNVSNGIKDGLSRDWSGTDQLTGESVYQSGKLIRHRSFVASSSASYWETDKYWENSPYPYQKRLKRWNRDGTPAEDGKEK